LTAGTARADITPPVGITHLPWGASTHDRAEEIDMELWASALVASDGTETVAIVELDHVLLRHEQAAAIRQAAADLSGIPADHILLSCTHNHSGPSLSPSWAVGGAELIPAYVESMRHAIAGAVWSASRSLRPARIAAGSGSSSVAVNRRLRLPEGRTVIGRNREGFVDHEVKVVRIDDLAERPIAILVNYAAHPTIMAFGNRLITPDYPGPLRRTVEREIGGTCLFLQGCAGNAHPEQSFSSRPQDYRAAGQRLGLEAARVALEIRTLPTRERLDHVQESGAPLGIYVDESEGEPDGRVRVVSRQVTLPLRDMGDPEAMAARAEEQQVELRRLEGQGAPPETVREHRWRMKRATMAKDAAREYTGMTEVSVEIHGIRIGQVLLLGIEGEPFTEIGRAIKDRSPFPDTLVCGYANGYGGLAYLPTDEAFADGGYEADWGTRYRTGAAPLVIGSALAVLAELAAG